ncbi:ferric reductase NAD binding domain-containing protein [Amylostereum chailletii]|nr:ferric reductase NAD binding domain-containing protein [Amylostereum chailletii]
MNLGTPTSPERLSPSLSHKALQSIDKVLRVQRAEDYPKQVWYFLACFIGLVGLANHVSLISFHRHRHRFPAQGDAETQRPSSTGSISYRRLPLAAVNAWRVIAFRSHVRIGHSYSLNLAEVFMTATYITILFVWTMYNTNALVGPKYDPKYYANRAGNIAARQLPLIVVLGTKNNIIGWITGVGYEKLNYLHRMASRTVMVLIWLHAAGRIDLGLTGETAITHYYIICGIVGAAALTILCLISIRPVRQVSYEFFLIIHFSFVLLFLVTSYFHAREWRYAHFVWPAFVFWGFDRILRVARLIIFNHSYFGFKSGVGTFDGTVELASPGFMRLRVRRPRFFRWNPGQDALLTMPSVSTLPWEAHPFTIASLCDQDEVLLNSPNLEEKTSQSTSARQGNELVFIVKTHTGFTKRLEDIAQKGAPVKVFIDGPYGVPPQLVGNDTVLFIAGGSGVSFTFPLFVDLIRRACKDQGTCRRVVFVWAFRHPENVNLVYDDLAGVLHDVPSSLEVEIRFYITDYNDRLDPNESSSVRSESASEKAENIIKLSGLAHAKSETRRPDLDMTIRDTTALAQGSVAVVVCGPSGMVVDVQRTLRSSYVGPSNVLRGGPSTTLFVENFGYN